MYIEAYNVLSIDYWFIYDLNIEIAHFFTTGYITCILHYTGDITVWNTNSGTYLNLKLKVILTFFKNMEIAQNVIENL
jgi:lipopolysaccharide biosynthesis glycosyltransferase